MLALHKSALLHETIGQIVSYLLFFSITHLAKLFEIQTFNLTQLGN